MAIDDKYVPLVGLCCKEKDTRDNLVTLGFGAEAERARNIAKTIQREMLGLVRLMEYLLRRMGTVL